MTITIFPIIILPLQRFKCNVTFTTYMFSFHADRITNSVEPDQTVLGLHCLLRPICPKTWDHCGTITFFLQYTMYFFEHVSDSWHGKPSQFLTRPTQLEGGTKHHGIKVDVSYYLNSKQ